MLELKNICKTYRPKNGPEVQALKSVSVKFAEKGLVFILGKSGCGKSTMLNCIGGLDRFDSGEIIIKGKSSNEFTGSDFDSYRNTFIGFIFQEYNILSEFNIEKNIALALELQGKNASKEEVQKILDMVDLGNMGKRKTTELSGGQKQRVAIARALIKDPEIIIADEPTGALDSATGIQVFETLKKLAEDKLIIVVSHDREFAEIYGDRIIEMKDGVIISDETKRKVAPNAVSDDLTFIGDDLIHIKKGHKFSADEKEMIIKFLESRDTETIISVDDRRNQKFKQVAKIDDNNHTEKFTETTDEDRKSKEYNKNELKLIKSRLKWKDSFKMGTSSLKTKPVRLMFTIVLSFIAFAIFGIVDALGTFNRPQAVYSTIKEFDNKYVSLLKEVPDEWGNSIMPWTESNVKAVSEKFPDITLKKVVGAGINFGSSYYPNYYNSRITLNGDGLKNETNNVAKTPFTSGMTYLEEDELASLGLTVVAGRLPVAGNEIAVSKHIYDCFNWLNSETIKTPDDLLKVEYNSVSMNTGEEYEAFKIVGVIDDGSDLTKYTNLTAEEINKDYELENKIARELSFGFSNMVYINESCYQKMLNKKISYNGLEIYKSDDDENNIGWFSSSFMSIEEAVEQEKWRNVYQFADRISYFKDGSESRDFYGDNYLIDLEEGTVILNQNILMGLSDYSYNKLEQGLLKVEAQQADGTLIKELTVVGYYQNNIDFNGIGLVSSADSQAFGTVDGGVQLVYDGAVIYTTSTDYKSLEAMYKEPAKSWSITDSDALQSLDIQHVKPGTNVSALAKNDVIITQDALQNLASGEELYTIIDSGLSIDVKLGKNAIFTFNVVGVAQGCAYVSNETKTTVIDPKYKGFDYVIAILSENESVDKEFIKYCETFNENNEKFTVQNGATPILDQFGEIISDVASVVFWVGVGFAVFAALLLMNFISTSISYKKREIGILRALGARSSDVFGIFFNESLVIALINFVLATVATFVASAIITNAIITQLGLQLVLLSTGIRQVVLILAVSVGTAFLASLLPVSGIAKKQPIDAINNR